MYDRFFNQNNMTFEVKTTQKFHTNFYSMLSSILKIGIFPFGRHKTALVKDFGNSKLVTSIHERGEFRNTNFVFFSLYIIATKYNASQKQFQQLLNLKKGKHSGPGKSSFSY